MSNFEVAFKRLSDLYGEPNWEREGQDFREIQKIWESELEGYTEEQIKEACYKLFRFRKTMTFPTISQLMSMLYDEETPTKKEEYVSTKCSCPEIELYELVKPSCAFGEFRYNFMKMEKDFVAYYPECEGKCFSDTVKAMKNNDWWENKITEYLQ